MPRKISNEEYLNIFLEIHNNYYSYPEGICITNSRKDYVVVKCPEHGIYKVRADHHKRGIKCRECSPGNKLGIFTKISAESHRDEWEKIDSMLYFLEIYDKEERFYKVGVTTFLNLKSRIKEFPSNYIVKILLTCENNLYQNVIHESGIKEDCSFMKYIPKKDFRGKEECFKENPLNYYYEN